jgi:hypothetical protein
MAHVLTERIVTLTASMQVKETITTKTVITESYHIV